MRRLCNVCHTCPSFVGHADIDNPFVTGGTLDEVDTPGPVNRVNYFAGGVHFGPFVSKNITPDPNEENRREGLTLEQFLAVMKTGHDPDQSGQILQVMPWPIFRHMTTHDLRAVYEYLNAIPHAELGTCNGPAEFQIRP